MRFLRGLGTFFWRFMVVFSFIVNLVLIIVLLVLGLLIFEIKNQVAQPLITGLHSSFVGLDQATIDWTIPVRDDIQVKLDIPLRQHTIVTLTEAVPLVVTAQIHAPGLTVRDARVSLQLPQGLELPVALDLDVGVDQPMPVELDVRAVIPLQQTQLHDVAENLRLLFEPLARGLHNLPDDFGEAGELVSALLAGDPPDLLADSPYSQNPWPGYSLTAGLGYELYTEAVPPQNLPMETGLVPIGGIPALDEQLRPEIYAGGGPYAINQQALESLTVRNVPSPYFDGQIGALIQSARADSAPAMIDDHGILPPDQATGGPLIPPTPKPDDRDMGIISTPEK
jgi:hypothetical protein